MKLISDLILPQDCKYTNEHIWVKSDGDTYLAGISDFAQDQLGEVVYVDLPNNDSNFATNDSFGEVESVKSVNKLFMPFSGQVIEVNANLEDSPALINQDCYEKAWIIRFKAQDKNEFSKLFSADQYREFLNS